MGVVVLRCVVFLALFFSIVLFLQASSALLDPNLQFVQLVAPVAKVGPLATVSGLVITRAARRYFTVWLAERLVAGLFGIAYPLPLLPLYNLLVGVIVLHGCSHRSAFYLPVVFSFLYFNGLHHYYYYHYYYYFTLVYFD